MPVAEQVRVSGESEVTSVLGGRDAVITGLPVREGGREGESN